MTMSHYANYILEREGKETIENEFGFVTYKFFGDAVYIVDIYVAKDCRQKGMAAKLADQVCDIAKTKGLKFVFGSCDVSANGATDSMRVLISYGMTVHSISGNLIYFIKSLGGENGRID